MPTYLLVLFSTHSSSWALLQRMYEYYIWIDVSSGGFTVCNFWPTLVPKMMKIRHTCCKLLVWLAPDVMRTFELPSMRMDFAHFLLNILRLIRWVVNTICIVIWLIGNVKGSTHHILNTELGKSDSYNLLALSHLVFIIVFYGFKNELDLEIDLYLLIIICFIFECAKQKRWLSQQSSQSSVLPIFSHLTDICAAHFGNISEDVNFYTGFQIFKWDGNQNINFRYLSPELLSFELRTFWFFSLYLNRCDSRLKKMMLCYLGWI